MHFDKVVLCLLLTTSFAGIYNIIPFKHGYYCVLYSDLYYYVLLLLSRMLDVVHACQESINGRSPRSLYNLYSLFLIFLSTFCIIVYMNKFLYVHPCSTSLLRSPSLESCATLKYIFSIFIAVERGLSVF